MGRHQKAIAFDRIVDRREIGYYSTPNFIANFLVQKLLEIQPQGKYVIDPCVGKGELLTGFLNSEKHLTCIDIVDFGFSKAHTFLHENFIVHQWELSSPRVTYHPIRDAVRDYLHNPSPQTISRTYVLPSVLPSFQSDRSGDIGKTYD